MTRRRGRRRKKLLDNLKDKRGYSHLKEEALWRHRFGGGFGPVVRQNTELMNELQRNFEQEYVRCVRNENECVCSAPNCCDMEQRSRKIIKEMPGSVASGTYYMIKLSLFTTRRCNSNHSAA